MPTSTVESNHPADLDLDPDGDGCPGTPVNTNHRNLAWLSEIWTMTHNGGTGIGCPWSKRLRDRAPLVTRGSVRLASSGEAAT